MNINFNFVDRQNLYNDLAINENLEVKRVNYGGFSYLSVENFFKKPEKAVEFLSNYPALSGGTNTPGARQNFTPMDLVPILQAYKSIIAIGNNEKIDPTSFITSSNIAWRDVKVMEGCMYPHSDFVLVCNLWLCDYDGGTAFYKYKGNLSVDDITPINKFPKPGINAPLVPWVNFDGDEDWELYHTMPTKFNTVAIYNGRNFHAPYIKFNDEYRYSLISYYRSGRSFSNELVG